MKMSSTFKSVAVTTTTLALTLAAVVVAPDASAAVSCTNVGTSFSNRLNPGQCIKSTNGSFVLVMQSDGNLVSYRNSNNQVCWASNTSGHPGAYAQFVNLDSSSKELDINSSSGANISGFGGNGGTNVSVGSTGKVFVGYGSYGGC